VAVQPMTYAAGDLERIPIFGMLLLCSLLCLLAAVNVAGLFLARAQARRGDTALRLALGASRGHLFRHFLSDGVVVAGCGLFLGLCIAAGLLKITLNHAGIDTPFLQAVRLGIPGLVFALGVGGLISVLFALAPLTQVRKLNLLLRMKEDVRRPWARTVLANVQFVMATLLLAVGGLVLAEWVRIARTPLGLEPSAVLAFRVEAPERVRRSPEAWESWQRELTTALAALPGVQKVGLGAFCDPVDYRGGSAPVSRADDPKGQVSSFVTSIDEGYLPALGLPLLHGRALRESDRRPGAKAVVLLSATLAQRLFPDRPAVGQRVLPAFIGREAEVIGVVGDVNLVAAVPFLQQRLYGVRQPQVSSTILIRGVNPQTILPMVRARLAQLDSAMLPLKPRLLSEDLAALLAPVRLVVLLAAGLALVGLVLAGIGLHGVIATLQTRELKAQSIRVALGATPTHLFAGVMRRGFWMLAPAFALGLAGGAAAQHYLSSLMYISRSLGFLPLLGTTLLLALVTFLALASPAFRAARLQPTEALRE